MRIPVNAAHRQDRSGCRKMAVLAVLALLAVIAALALA
jgi:hypothetical protein